VVRQPGGASTHDRWAPERGGALSRRAPDDVPEAFSRSKRREPSGRLFRELREEMLETVFAVGCVEFVERLI
jgi:hypothetical protein